MFDFRIISKETIYKGWMTVSKYTLCHASLNPEKKTVHEKREVVETGDTIFVLLYVPQTDSFVLQQEWRAGILVHPDNDDPLMIQGCAGFIEPGESPQDAARREVFEETGIEVENLDPLVSVYASPGFLTEKTAIYLGYVKSTPKTGLYGAESESEEVRTQLIPRSKAYQYCDEGKIFDAKTLLAICLFRLTRLNSE